MQATHVTLLSYYVYCATYHHPYHTRPYHHTTHGHTIIPHTAILQLLPQHHAPHCLSGRWGHCAPHTESHTQCCQPATYTGYRFLHMLDHAVLHTHTWTPPRPGWLHYMCHPHTCIHMHTGCLTWCWTYMHARTAHHAPTHRLPPCTLTWYVPAMLTGKGLKGAGQDVGAEYA